MRVRPAKRRTVPLPSAVVRALIDHRERQAQERAAARMECKEHGLIFTSRIGTPLEPDHLRRSWHPPRSRLGLEIRFHDLRHSAVSLLLDLGVRGACGRRAHAGRGVPPMPGTVRVPAVLAGPAPRGAGAVRAPIS
ncbi:tyrosine-type recombinase/integrase [Streptomyces sp. NPDC004393]